MDPTAMSDHEPDPEIFERLANALTAIMGVFAQEKLSVLDAVRVSGMALTQVLQLVPLKHRQMVMDCTIDTVVSQATKQ